MTAQDYFDQALAYEKQNDHTKALELYEACIQADETFAQAFGNRAVLLYYQGDIQASLKDFKRAIKLQPDYAPHYSNMGAVLAKVKQYRDAVQLYLKAIQLQPNFAGAHTNLGNALNKIGEYEQAIFYHLRAISLDNTQANHYANTAVVYKNLGRFDKAKVLYQKALQLNPNHIDAHFDLSTVLLMTDAFAQGFKEYEWRFKKDEMRNHIANYKEIFDAPRWMGQSLKGRTILLHSEQGYGDMLMVIRYVNHLKERGVHTIIVSVREALVRLFKSIDVIDMVIAREDNVPKFDYQLSIMSLPLMCDASLLLCNDFYPYILNNQHKSIDKSTKRPIKVGITWGASATGESYTNKVVPLSFFEDIIRHSAFEVHSLQVGDDAKQLEAYAYKDNIIDKTHELQDFYDTAHYIQKLDLVISVDTSVAHLAGAMGLDVWVLLQKVPDWRWGVDSEHSLWYKSATLIRQYSLGDWASVRTRLLDKLAVTFEVSFT